MVFFCFILIVTGGTVGIVISVVGIVAVGVVAVDVELCVVSFVVDVAAAVCVV